MRVREAVLEAELRLAAAGIGAPRLEAEVLVAQANKRDRNWVVTHTDDAIDDSFIDLVSRRVRHEPLAYITGWREFYGRRFAVTPDVLIPRHETETLIDVALSQQNVKTVLDVGTGSGCIAVTLAAERPDWVVTAVDVSSLALDVATRNAQQYDLGVAFVLSDLFQSLTRESFDLIVSNPPYVSTKDELPEEVKYFEPHQALFAGEDGLAVYRRIATEAGAHLNAGGHIILEVGDGQSDEVAILFEASGWQCVSRHKDLNGTERALVFNRNGHLP